MRLPVYTAIVLCALAWVFAPAAASAQRRILVETSAASTPNGKPAAALSVNGRLVAKLAKPQRGRSPLASVSAAAALLTEAYRSGETELSVEASEGETKSYTILLNGKALFEATSEEGKAWGATPEQLATTWRNNIIQALGLPAATLPVTKAPTGKGPKPQNGKPKPAEPAGVGSVSGALTVASSQKVYDPPAGTALAAPIIPPDLTARVTGSALAPEHSRQSVEAALRAYAGIGAATDIRWQVIDPPEARMTVAPGAAARLTVNYVLGGQDMATQGESVQVLLENRALAVPRETITFFSNVPEGVEKPQLLYFSELPQGQSGRLVFHHQNQGYGTLRFIARLINTGSETSAVHVIPGTCAPNINTFLVGFKSAESFWANLNHGNGYVLKLAPGRQAFLTVQTLSAGFTTSGYYKLTNLGGQPLRIETLTLPAGGFPSEGPLSAGDSTSRGVFPAPYINISERYAIGDDWLYLRLGKESLSSTVDDQRLDGSYGVTYSFNVELSNETAAPALVFVVLRASAGEVKGQFFIDGEYVTTSLVAGGDEQLLKEVPLAPGAKRLLKIKALPLNGGFYPASIILRESRLP